MEENGTMADNRYQNGKIYRLVNSVDDEFYVGSTCTSLAKRFYNHKKDAKRDTSRQVYAHLNDVGWDNVSIVLVCSSPCQSKNELERKEREVIEELKPSLNKNKPGRTLQDDYECKARYAETNPEKVRESKTRYAEANPEKVRESKARYVEANREKVRESKIRYNMENKEKILESRAKVREQNREKIREYFANYYQANKEKLKAYHRELYAKQKALREKETP